MRVVEVFRLPTENISSVLFDQSRAVNILPFRNVHVFAVCKVLYADRLFFSPFSHI